MTAKTGKPELIITEHVDELWTLMHHPRYSLYYVPKTIKGKKVLEVYLID